MERSIENLAQWMTLLPEPIKQIPIINLAIPGKKNEHIQIYLQQNE